MSRIVAAATTAGLIAASILFVAAPASADPGDASATGAFAGLDISIGPIVIDEQEVVGSVFTSLPGTDSFADDDVTLVDAILASITIDEVATVAESSSTASSADAAALGTSANLFGISVVSFDTAASAVACPVGGTPTAEATLEGLRIFGVPVELSDDEVPTATDSISLPSDVAFEGDELDLSGLTLHVTVGQPTEVGDDYAIASAFTAVIELEGSYANSELTRSIVGILELASTSCQTPPAAPAPAVLAATGSDAAPVMFLSLGVLAAGAALLAVRRRRTS